MDTQNKQLISEASKRFQQIMEYTMGYGSDKGMFVDEEDQEQDQQDATQQDGGNSAPMGPDTQGGMDPIAGNAPMAPDAQGGDAPMGDPNAMGGPQGAAEQNAPAGPEGFAPQVPQDGMMGGEAPMDGGVQPDDEVIDISDLTDSQEETEEKVDDMDAKFSKVLSYLDKFADMIKSNDEKIEGLTAEFEKRNPTQIEKLGMQTARSYPFNQTPDEYWANKTQTSNYSTEDDDNGKEQPQYTITKNDIDSAQDWKTIADSLNDFDPYHQTMKNTMPM